MSGDHEFLEVELAPRSLKIERRDSGEIILRSGTPLADTPPHILEYLLHWAKAAPQRPFLCRAGCRWPMAKAHL